MALVALGALALVAALGGVTRGRVLAAGGPPAEEPDDYPFPPPTALKPFYYGPLRSGGEPVLLVVAKVKEHPDQLIGDGHMWLYRRAWNGSWDLAWKEAYTPGFPNGFEVFRTPADKTKQIAVYSGGVDNIQITIYGLRGKDYRPKELLFTAGKCYPLLETENGRPVVVEHWELYGLVLLHNLKLPLEPRLRGHVFVRRTYVYRPERDRYELRGTYEPDVARERSLTAAQRQRRREELQQLIRERQKTQ